MLTNLHLGAKVTGFNDESLGTVKYLVADPQTDQITHLVVHEDKVGSRDILVESGRLNKVSEDGDTVSLNLDRQQLVNLPDFVDREFVTSEIEANPTTTRPAPADYGDNPVPVEAGVFPGMETATLDPVNPPMTPTAPGLGLVGTSNGVFGNTIGPVGRPVQETLNVPQDSLIIREGASVEALDGHIGKVKEVNLDPANGRISSFVVEKGLFILDDYTVPVEMVESANQDQVFLKLTKNDFKNAPLTPDQSEGTTTYPADTDQA